QDSLYIRDALARVIRTKDFVDLSAAVEARYPDMVSYEKELAKALRYVKYYFPEYEVPRFITFVGGFSFQTPIGNDYVGIGLDMFLGADSKFYPALVQSIPLYISRRFTPENIVPRVIEAILREDIYPQLDGSVNTLAHMIYNGKILYAMDCVLDNVPDELKIGYTEEQLKWARRYQQDIWAWFVQDNLLYNTDFLRIQKYFTEAPFTPELGEGNESAPKLGSYSGWMIVRKYMENHPNVGLKELFANENAQEILEGSKYRGK
ncbi:MAG TPA: gliding motility lipoprotein GldB, partial [Sphingobacterium sp.]|nr:gliding motility lipoprotein GldB [Sphingobacterium sp.]